LCQEPKPLAPTRPTAGTAFGILNIVFASLGLLCSPIVLLMGNYGVAFQPPQQQGVNNPALIIMNDPGYRVGMLVINGLNIIAQACQLAAGIGLLRMKSWGRTLSLGYAAYALLALVGGTIFNYFYTYKPLIEALRQVQDPAVRSGLIGGMIGGGIGLCLGPIYPILLLYFLTRPRIAGAFRPPQSEIWLA